MRFHRLYTLGDANDNNLCFLDNFIDGLNMQSWRVREGESLAPVYPEDARIFMNPENPGIKLSSLIGNTKGMLIGSRDFKDTVAKHCENSIEYLPFTLHDHRRRVFSRDYFLINPLGSLDCLDIQKSDIKWSKEEPGEILRINSFVLDREKVKEAPQLFRVDKDPSTYVVGAGLAQELRDRQLTNVEWTELPFGDEL